MDKAIDAGCDKTTPTAVVLGGHCGWLPGNSAKTLSVPWDTNPNTPTEPFHPKYADEEMVVGVLNELTLGEELGYGGTASVRVAQQHSLGRRVAVKSLYSDSEFAREMLLREASVIGALEHPNIVPIHDLAVDAEGQPQLVLKLIEGRTWHELMGDPGAILDMSEEDTLEWHIRIVISISQAVSFAHERGIVHRDIKPSNIMIGRFGEVYLVDWGLAAAFKPSAAPLPVAQDRSDGTPSYMAPEQYEGEGSRIGPWTDVYLMAGSLFHALSSVAPWTRAPSGVRERNRLAESIPQELRWILARAMAPDPEVRTQSAETLRQELLAFLRHRGSQVLVDRAMQKARRFDTARSRGETEQAERAATEAALLFRVALDQWRDNPAAVQGELDLTRARVEDAVARQEPDLARALLSALPNPPDGLRELVGAALDEAAQETVRVRKMEDDIDVAAIAMTRTSRLALGGPLWLGVWVVAAFTESASLTLACLTGIILLAVLTADRSLLANRLNRTVLLAALLTAASTTVAVAMTLATSQTLLDQAPTIALLSALGAAIGAASVDALAGIYALFWALLVPACLVIPSMGLWLIVAGSVVTVCTAGWVNVRNRQRMRARQSDPGPLPQT